MSRFFTQTKLIVLFYVIGALVIVQGVYEWYSLKQLESSMPVNLLERNISLSRVVFSLNQLEAVLAEVEQQASEANRDKLVVSLEFAVNSLQSYWDSEEEVSRSHLREEHEHIMEVFQTMSAAIRANTIFETPIIQSLHSRYREAMVPFPQDYFNQSKSAFASLVLQTTRISELRYLAMVISLLLILSLLIVAFMSMSRQKTLRMLRAEQRERFRSEALLSAVIENAPYVMYLKDLTGKYLLCNPAFSELYNIPQEECIGLTARDVSNPEQAAEHEEMDRSCLACDLPISYEYELGEGDDSSTYSILKFPIKDNRGVVIGIGGISIDITQRKSAVSQLSKQKAVMESILSHVPVGVYLKDLKGRYILCNRSFCDWHNIKPKELKDKTAGDLFSPEKARFFEEKDRECRETLSVVEHESDIQLSAGGEISEHTIRFPVLDDAGHLLGTGGIDINISQRKQAEQELEVSRNRFQALADNLPEFITLKDTQGRFLFVNRRFEEWTGMSRDDTVCKSVYDVYSPEQAREFNRLDNQVIKSGEIYSHEIDLEYPNNRPTRTVISTRFPVLSEDGEVLGMGTINHDISERKQAEIALRIAKEQAESADRLKSSFLATMSHELRTPLNSIIGFTGILLKGLAGELNGEQAKQLGMVKKSATHLLSLINDILDISKIEAGSMNADSTAFEIQPSIDSSVELVTPVAEKKSLRIEVKQADQPIEICSDQRRVEQIVLNLLSNAIKFSETGAIKVETKSLENRIEIAVSDSGTGIKEEDLPRLFQPFHQLDQSGPARRHEGSGLGLALSQKLAQILGGDIRVQSCWGEGSVFTLELPLNQ